MIPQSEEHRIGALLLALAMKSAGNYVLVRSGRHPTMPRREWRVSVRRDQQAEQTSAGEALVQALERAWLRQERA
jgi:hypothetical protein